MRIKWHSILTITILSVSQVVARLGEPPVLSALNPVVDFVHTVERNTQTWMDETGTAHVGIRSVDDDNYSLYTLGCMVKKTSVRRIAAGYGIGRQLKFKRLYTTIDALAQLRTATTFDPQSMFLLFRLRLGAGIRIGKKYSLFGGIAFRNTNSDNRSLLPSFLFDQSHQGKIWRDNWPGFFIGIQY